MKLKILYKNFITKSSNVVKQKNELIETIKKIRQESENYKNTYWVGRPDTSAKRQNFRGERTNISKSFPKFKLLLEFKIELDCSCKHVYKRQELFINNEIKTLATLKTIENDLRILNLLDEEVKNV